MARILLGVSGGIAAYKALDLVRLATAEGHSVRVIQTPASERFVGSASFAALTGAPVLTGEFEHDPAAGAFPGDPRPTREPLSHLALVANADVYLIAPASANTIAKLAHGVADNLLTSAALACTAPVVVAPAMNGQMYEHPATRANVATLLDRGVHVVGPVAGRLASWGEEGVGRLADPVDLLAACRQALESAPSIAPNRPWEGLRVLVTAGGTREPIDSVRFIANSSSGRMGLALARAALTRGAHVTVIAANVTLPRPERAGWIEVTTAAQMRERCEREFPACDVLLMAAAVADFRPVTPVAEKIKKQRRERLELVLEATPDVLKGLAAVKRAGQSLVGFAAEHGESAAALAVEKLHDKGLDAIVVNDISQPNIGFEVDFNEVTIITAESSLHVPRTSKDLVAEAILDAITQLRSPSSAASQPPA